MNWGLSGSLVGEINDEARRELRVELHGEIRCELSAELRAELSGVNGLSSSIAGLVLVQVYGTPSSLAI